MKGLLERVRRELWKPPNDQFGGLNGLRGLASHLVTFYHVAIFSGNFPLLASAASDLSPTHRVLNGFWTGLDIFFVLSGFLIGRILMTSLERTGRVEFVAFFVRRCFRIFPAYYVVLTFGLFYFARLPGAISWHLRPNLAWSVLLADAWQNYTYSVNYFFGAGASNAMSWAWSLCIEEHFYLALPLVLTLSFKTRRPGLRPAILIAGIAVPFAIRAIQYAHNPDIVLLDGFYYRTHNRVDEIFYGVIVAYFYVYHRDAFKARALQLGNWTWILGLALVLSVWVFGGLQVQGLFAVVFQFSLTAAGAALLLVNCLFLDNGFTRFFAHRFWFPSARASYGIYLIHPYVLFWILYLLGDRSAKGYGAVELALLGTAVIVVSMSIASASYVLFESRLIELGRALGKRLARSPV